MRYMRVAVAAVARSLVRLLHIPGALLPQFISMMPVKGTSHVPTPLEPFLMHDHAIIMHHVVLTMCHAPYDRDGSLLPVIAAAAVTVIAAVAAAPLLRCYYCALLHLRSPSPFA